MSDLQTEIFTKVLPKMQTLTNLNFDDPEQPMEQPMNFNKEVFYWLQKHPRSSAGEVIKAHPHIASTTIYSILSNLSNDGLFRKSANSTNGRFVYSAVQGEYPKLNADERLARLKAGRERLGDAEISARIRAGHMKKKEVAKPERQVVMIERPKAKPEPAPQAAVQVTPVDLNTLSIVQARKLYDELKQIFGG